MGCGELDAPVESTATKQLWARVGERMLKLVGAQPEQVERAYFFLSG